MPRSPVAPVISTVPSGPKAGCAESSAPGAGTARRARRGANAAPSRRTSSGSPAARAAAIVPARDSAGSAGSRSRRTKRPGFSFCAVRRRPRTPASATSPGWSGSSDTAPRVSTTKRESPYRASPSHFCTSSRAPSVAARRAAAGSSPSGGVTGARRTAGTSVVPSSNAAHPVGSPSPVRPGNPGNPGSPSTAQVSAAGVAAGWGTRVHSTWKRASSPVFPALRSASAEMARDSRDSTVTTGAPVPSDATSRSVSAPVRVSRTRSTEAPAPCTVRPDQENGRPPWRSSSTTPRSSGWRAASRSAGWRANWAASVRCLSGRATSAKISPSGDRQARRRPWKAGP